MNKSRGACGPCRIAHTACDGQRPCRRCTTLGKDEDCVDIERKRPGRPKGGRSKSLEAGQAVLSIKKARLDAPAPAPGAVPIVDGAPGTASTTTPNAATAAAAVPAGTAKQETSTTALKQPIQTPQSTLRPLRQTPAPPSRFPTLASAFTPLTKIPLPPLSPSSAMPLPKLPLPPLNSTFSASTSLSAPSASSSLATSSPTSASASSSASQPSSSSSAPQSSTSSSSSSSSASPSAPSPSSSSGTQSRTPLPIATGRPFLPNPSPPLRTAPLTTTSPASADSGKARPKDTDVPDKVDFSKAANPYLESLLSFLVEEVKELKQTNTSMKDEFRRTVKKLKSDISQLQETQQRMDKEKRNLEERLSALSMGTPLVQKAQKSSSLSSPHSPCATSSPITPSPSSLPSSSSSTTTTTSSSSPPSTLPGITAIPMAQATSRTEILSSFPFLSSYNLQSNDVPFVLDNLNKPFLAVRTMEASAGEENTPMVIAVNPPFCQLMNYSLHELLGCPLSKIIVPDEKLKKQFLPALYNRRPNSLISDICPLSPLCVPKDGKMIRLSSRIQLFFSDNGVMRWSVTVVEGIEEAPASVEAPMTWLPGLPKWWSAYANMSSTPLPLATLRASFSPKPSSVPSSLVTAGGSAGEALSKELASRAATGGGGGASVTGKRKLGDRSYDLGELLSNFAAPIPTPPAGTGDFAWLLKDGVGGGLVYAGSRGGDAPTPSQGPWLPELTSKKTPLSSAPSGSGLGATLAGGRGGAVPSPSSSREQAGPRLGGRKPW